MDERENEQGASLEERVEKLETIVRALVLHQEGRARDLAGVEGA